MKSTSVMLGIASLAGLVDYAGCSGLEFCSFSTKWWLSCTLQGLKAPVYCSNSVCHSPPPPVLLEKVKLGYDNSVTILLRDLHEGQGFTIVPEGSGS